MNTSKAVRTLLSRFAALAINRDSKVPELYALAGTQYRLQPAGADGWIRSAATGIELRAGVTGKLAIRLAADEGTRKDLP